MLKMFFLTVLLFVLEGSTFAGVKSSNDSIRVDGFIKNEPLTKNGIVFVLFSEHPDDWIPCDAYKGETKKVFLKRMNFLSKKELSNQYFSPVSKNLKKVKSYRQPLPWDKFSDSVMSEKKEPKFVEKKTDQVVPKNKAYYLLKVCFIVLVGIAILFAVNQWTYRFDEKTLTKKLP